MSGALDSHIMGVMAGAAISEEDIRASLARDSLKDFIQEAWHLVEPETNLVWNWHLDVVCDVLEAISRGELKRVIFNVPPGTGKSLIVSVFWNAWEWATSPFLRYLTASYSDANTIRDNRRLRTIVQSEWYKRHFEATLSTEQWAKIRFDTEQKGFRIASSVGGMGTGEHPDRIIIDDPLKAADADSEVQLDLAIQWYNRTISTRISRDPAIVIIMQRLHEKDLAGHLLSQGGWHHVCFPMRFVVDDLTDPRDTRIFTGHDLLWPEAWPEEKVRQEELDLGPFGTAGQLQQRPVPEGGGLYKREWFMPVDALPAGGDMRLCRGWDTAATEGGGDWTVGVKLLEHDSILYVADVVRGQLGPAGVDALMQQTALLDGQRCMQREEQEPGAAGKSVIAARAKLMKGLDYRGVSSTGNKVTRAKPFRAQAEAGNVRMLRAPWNKAYLDVMASFPVGIHDDDADATSVAYNSLVEETPKPVISATW